MKRYVSIALAASFLTSALAQNINNINEWPERDIVPPQNDAWVLNVTSRMTAATPLAPVILDCFDPRQWAFTYDDGPSPATLKLLAYLRLHNIKATFFLVGSRVIENPSIVKIMHDDGHHIALHSWAHNDLATLDDAQVITDLQWNINAIKAAAGITPRYIRPPFGSFNAATQRIFTAMGLTPVNWNRDTLDWRRVAAPNASPEQLFAEVETWMSDALPTGVISLQHDLVALAVDWAITILDRFRDVGRFELVPVGTCLKDDKWYAEERVVNASQTNSTSGEAAKKEPARGNANTSGQRRSILIDFVLLFLLIIVFLNS